MSNRILTDTQADLAATFSPRSSYRYDFGPGLDPFQVVGPGLHHLLPFRHELCMVVRRTHAISFGMGKLALDGVPVPPVFIQQCAGHAPETMAAHLILGIPHSPQGGQNSVAAHRP